MTSDDYLTLLRQALTAPHGIALRLGNFDKAERARGKLYRLRRTLHRSGDQTFDGLSFFKDTGGDLWIVRRDKLPRRIRDDGLQLDSRELTHEELPDHFGYRNYSFSVSKPKR
ncbi:MAG: hypothetical protein VCD50_15105 [Alphaproteobacteria bacterium]